jgi:hypothetical protein
LPLTPPKQLASSPARQKRPFFDLTDVRNPGGGELEKGYEKLLEIAAV